MVSDGTWVVDAKGVECVSERCFGTDCILSLLESKVCDGCRLGVGTSLS